MEKRIKPGKLISFMVLFILAAAVVVIVFKAVYKPSYNSSEAKAFREMLSEQYKELKKLKFYHNVNGYNIEVSLASLENKEKIIESIKDFAVSEAFMSKAEAFYTEKYGDILSEAQMDTYKMRIVIELMENGACTEQYIAKAPYDSWHFNDYSYLRKSD